LRSDLPAYFSTWSDEIASRADRVRHLIGSRHWLSDGTHKEFLIRDFLLRYLPSNLLVGRGFVRATTSEDVTPEIDVLIIDPARHVPLFNEGGLLIAAPSATISTIEVKSTYRKAVLKEAMQNVFRVRSVTAGTGRGGVWSAIMFAGCDAEVSVRAIVDDVVAVLEASGTWEKSPLIALSSNDRLIPAVVCVLDRFCLLLNSDSLEGSVNVRGFDAGRASAALAFAQLFAFVRATLTGDSVPGELDEMLERIDGIPIYAKQVKVP